MSNQQLTPTEKIFLDRVINSQGEPIDNKGPLAGGEAVIQRAQQDLDTLLSSHKQGQASTEAKPQMLTTGIKVIDLLAPLPYGGLSILDAPYGVGKMVVCSEVIHTLIEKQQAAIIVVALGETSYENSQAGLTVLEAQFETQTCAIFATESDADAARCQQMLQLGFAIAQQIRSEGREVGLLLDNAVLTRTQRYSIETVHQAATQLSVTTIIEADSQQQKLAPSANSTHLLFDRRLAQAKHYPAVDRLHSTTVTPLEAILSNQHKQIAVRVRETLRQGEALQNQAILSTEEQQILARARRLSLFFTQPFFVAELFSGVPGEYVSLAETLKDCQELLADRYNTLPDAAFLMIGTLDQAIAKAKQLN